MHLLSFLPWFLPWIIGAIVGFILGWYFAGHALVLASARIASELMYAQIGEWRDLLLAASTSDPKYKDEKIALLLQLIEKELGQEIGE